ncbi:MAG TPA: hypothetical protein VHX11_07850 [Acidobacteriaceae bacterium]|jgi:hypothetical protein|nr:hypothetical protein [Acidobacteriaceae bacterium]
MKKILCSLFSVLLLGLAAFAQTPVVLSPVPQLQFFDASGRTLAFGCVFTYASGTTTPLATFTDSTGITQNANPVVLSAGGSANIWIEAGVAYSFRVKSSGGTNCSSGATLYTVNGIGGGLTLLTTNVTYSSTPAFPIQAQNQLFEITLTGDAVAQPITAVGILPPAWIAFQITQDAAGGHSFTWPANSVGGCGIGQGANQVTTQFFVWNGSTLVATGACVIGNGPQISVGSIVSGCANAASAGLLRACKTDAINWRNNANSGDQGISEDGSDVGIWSFAGGFETTGAVPDLFLGGKTSSFPRLKRNGTAINVRLADDSGDAPITASSGGFSLPVTSTSTTYALGGPELTTPASNPSSGQQDAYFKAGKGICALDSTGKEYCTAANSGTAIAILAHYYTTLGSDVPVSGETAILTQAVTMPSSGCPCRALVSYGYYFISTSHGLMEGYVTDGTNLAASSETNNFADGNETGANGAATTQVTYANSASVTFTFKVYPVTAIGATVEHTNGTAFGQPVWLDVAIFSSN